MEGPAKDECPRLGGRASALLELGLCARVAQLKDGEAEHPKVDAVEAGADDAKVAQDELEDVQQVAGEGGAVQC